MMALNDADPSPKPSYDERGASPPARRRFGVMVTGTGFAGRAKLVVMLGFVLLLVGVLWGGLGCSSQAATSTSAIVTTTLQAAAVPAAPSNVEATILPSSSIRVTWSDNSSNEDGFWLSDGVTYVDVPAGTTSYTWTHPTPDIYTGVAVSAYASAGQSAWTDWVIPTAMESTTTTTEQVTTTTEATTLYKWDTAAEIDGLRIIVSEPVKDKRLGVVDAQGKRVDATHKVLTTKVVLKNVTDKPHIYAASYFMLADNEGGTYLGWDEDDSGYAKHAAMRSGYLEPEEEITRWVTFVVPIGVAADAVWYSRDGSFGESIQALWQP